MGMRAICIGFVKNRETVLCPCVDDEYTFEAHDRFICIMRDLCIDRCSKHLGPHMRTAGSNEVHSPTPALQTDGMAEVLAELRDVKKGMVNLQQEQHQLTDRCVRMETALEDITGILGKA